MDTEESIDPELAEDAEAAIRDGIERARELVCEAKLVMRQPETLTADPINPAT